MSSSVMNGAIGKNPLIDTMNKLAEKEVNNRTTMQTEQLVLSKESMKFPDVSFSFPECRKEMEIQLNRKKEK